MNFLVSILDFLVFAAIFGTINPKVFGADSSILQRVTVESDRGNSSILPKSESLSGNHQNLASVSQIATARKIKSICVQSGLWGIYKNENYANVAAILYTSGVPDDRACTNDGVNGTNPIYKSIRHVGNIKLKEAGISFYKETFFQGDELYFDGFKLNLHHPIKIRSFGFTGKDNWTVYENPKFHGTSACLLSSFSSENSRPYDAVVYNKDLNLTVGSVRRGCGRGEESGNDQSKSIFIFPTGEIRSVEFGRAFDVNRNSDSLQLKINQRNDNNSFIYTDGNELRLPVAQELTFQPSVQGVANWTVFTGRNFDGKMRCFNPSESNSQEMSHTNSLEIIDEVNAKLVEDYTDKSVTYKIGSIKRGCTVSNSSRESRLLSDDASPVEEIGEKKISKIYFASPNNKIFLISFLIGLGFFIFFIILAISTISYFYCHRRG